MATAHQAGFPMALLRRHVKSPSLLLQKSPFLRLLVAEKPVYLAVLAPFFLVRRQAILGR